MNILLDLLGSPFLDRPILESQDSLLLDAYAEAFPNRVALLLLTLHRREGWDPRLEGLYQELSDRENATRSVIAALGAVLNEWNKDKYVIFKSIKPYPATPNDTDVICLGGSADYEQLFELLLDRGYQFHEWAPQQRTLYDPRGKGKIGSGKKGGTYYIDLYEEISTDYFSYMDKRRLNPFVFQEKVDGVEINLLRPEPELAIVMFHSVFPERTFQLEHFYYPLYAFASRDFDIELFLRFSRESGVGYAISTQASLIAWLHEREFGFVPEPVERVLSALGENRREVGRFAEREGKTPYLFSPRTFWTAFALKAQEWYCFRSLIRQCVKMLDPRFFMDVLRSIRLRMSERGAYHLE